MRRSLSLDQAIGQTLLLAFDVKALPSPGLRPPSPEGGGEKTLPSSMGDPEEECSPLSPLGQARQGGARTRASVLPLSPRERVAGGRVREDGPDSSDPAEEPSHHTEGEASALTYPELLDAFRRIQPAGITLFRHLNVDTPEQVRQLTTDLQRTARDAGLPPLLIAIDQEGGQLMAIDAGATQLPGNMALGAAASADLARRAGEVLGRELAAMGINVDYAPSCDVNINPHNPVIGTRSFGEDPQAVARLGAAMVEGIQSAGVAACAKHFPGHGDTASDSHHSLPQVPHSRDRLDRVELPPFQAAVRAGVHMVMTAHLGLPSITGRTDLPATLSPQIVTGLLRQVMAFQGVVVTDAMDMHAIRQGEHLGEDAVRAVAAGCDLLLLTQDPGTQTRVSASLQAAVRDGHLSPGQVIASAGRVLDLKRWLAGQPARPDLSVVGCSEHRMVADEIARRSITLVRDETGLLPLRLEAGEPLVVIQPRPQNLTPADTSRHVTPTLAQALRAFHQPVEEIIVPHTPDEQDIATVLEQVRPARLAVVGTVNASAQPGQAALVRAVLQTGIPTLVVALRIPYDLAAFPEAPAYLCTYSLLEPSMQALARVLFGQDRPSGRLPVSIPGLYPCGYALP